jgi:hypothetical protein
MAETYEQPTPPTENPLSASEPPAGRWDEEKVQEIAGEIHASYTTWKQYRQPHESDWLVTAAMLRGQQHVEYNAITASLNQPEAPSYAIRIDLNKMLPKHRGRMAKFFKARPKPVVVPASTQYQDLMDARATERAINYQWQRLRLESAYRDARQWASVCSKSYWWIGYDDKVPGQVRLRDELTGKDAVHTIPLGDVFVEVGNAWEVLVKDPSLARIGQQSEIMRVRTISKKEAIRRFPQLKDSKRFDVGGGHEATSAKQVEDRIAGFSLSGHSGDTIKRPDAQLLCEHFMAPCGAYPKGRKVCLVDWVPVAYEEELPFEFWDSPTNPYPCVEFADSGLMGQFWQTTWNAQMIPLQRGLNFLAEVIMSNLGAVGRPKIVLYKQHGLAEGAWTDSPGEIVELNWIPGLPEPRFVAPANVCGDAWNMVNLLLNQFDDMSQVHTAAEGGTAGTESGYQVNLLQEATDAVFAPDIRGDELAIEDAAWKIRRIMKQTWDVPRLISLGGEGASAEMVEFSQRQINDAAEVRIQVGSMMPELKAAKAQATLNYYKEGLFGDPNDPMVKRRALSVMDMGGYEVITEHDRLNEDQARLENQALMEDRPVDTPQYFHQHLIHIYEHEARMKTPEWAMLPDEAKLQWHAHLIQHYDFVNLPLAMGLRHMYQLIDVPVAAPPPPSPAEQAAPPPGQAPPAPAPPSGPPA